MRRAARAIIVEEGKLLAFERRRLTPDGTALEYLSIPGGRIEEHETAEQAVIRELREEMAITITPGPLVATVAMQATAPHESEQHLFFLATRVAGEPHFNLQSEEASGHDQSYILTWRKLDELMMPPALHPIYAPVLNALLPYLSQGTIPTLPLDMTIDNLL